MYLEQRIENYFYNTGHIFEKGSYGCVYREIDQNTQTEVAIKSFKKAIQKENYIRRTQLSKQKMLNSRVGTPLYKSPQVQQNSNSTSKCDVWSIGILYYECLYGATSCFHELSTKLLKKDL